MATARDLSSTRDKVLEILKDWTKHRLGKYAKFDEVYVFGSLFSQEGRRFVQTSDVDLVVRISKADASSPTRIVEACEALLVPKRNLEKQLADILGPPSSRQRVSVLAITAFRFEHDMHKDGKQCFYLDNDFLDLNNASFGANPLAHSTATTLTLSPFYFRPLSALQLAQKYRNIFLSVGPIGPSTECGLESWDGPEAIPEENIA